MAATIDSAVRYVFITGGVMSSIGKGIVAASLGMLLKQRGVRITILKLDPYFNVDPGTMNPFQHGEVFVTDDGTETDLDLGHYERFTDQSHSQTNNATAGQIYDTVISRERKGEYLGGTVQTIPHITDEIKRRIIVAGEKSDAEVVIVEIGGTVGDIESLPFLEAIRQMRLQVGPRRSLFVHVTYLPYLSMAKEMKTKPTQHSVKELREIGIQPDILVPRTSRPMDDGVRAKIALFCNVEPEAVIESADAASIYDVPLAMHRGGLDSIVARQLELPGEGPDLREWTAMVDAIHSPERSVKIAVVGKYIHLVEAYKSISEAFVHAGISNQVRVNTVWVDSEDLLDDVGGEVLRSCNGILVPGGFGLRGIEGKLKAVRIARESAIPYLGICLGLQMAVIEFARNVCGIEGATSGEFDPNAEHKVIDLLPEQREIKNMGATMRLGACNIEIDEGSIVHDIYGKTMISERHRHRYEVNNDYRELLRSKGLRDSGRTDKRDLVEIVEFADHPFFVASQFHPEFKSRPVRPHPLFHHFVKAAAKHASGVSVAVGKSS